MQSYFSFAVLALVVTTVSSSPVADSGSSTTSFPDLVPSTTVDLATDSTGGSFTGTPKDVPSTIVTLPGESTTSGCVVSISDYSYVTTCTGSQAASTTAAVGEASTTATISAVTYANFVASITASSLTTSTVSASGTNSAVCVVSAEGQGRWDETPCTTTSATTSSIPPLQDNGSPNVKSGAASNLSRLPGLAMLHSLRRALRF